MANKMGGAGDKTGSTPTTRERAKEFISAAQPGGGSAEESEEHNTHKAYYRLAIKETVKNICTLCAKPGHLWFKCPARQG